MMNDWLNDTTNRHTGFLAILYTIQHLPSSPHVLDCLFDRIILLTQIESSDWCCSYKSILFDWLHDTANRHTVFLAILYDDKSAFYKINDMAAQK